MGLATAIVWIDQTDITQCSTGVTATIVNDGCMTPWDVVKQRMQVSHSPYSGVFNCIRKTFEQEGSRAFFKSFWTTVRLLNAMNDEQASFCVTNNNT